MAKVTKTYQYGNHEVTLETGEIARQASGAVMVIMGGTVLLVTAVASGNSPFRSWPSSCSAWYACVPICT